MERKLSYEELKAKVAARSIEEIRAMPDGMKINEIFELTEALRESIKDKLRDRYPEASHQEILRRFAVVSLGRGLTKKAYGWEVVGDDRDLLVW